MVASPVENPPCESSPDFVYEPCRGSKEEVIGECQKEEAAGLEPENQVTFLFLAVVLVFEVNFLSLFICS